MLQPSSALAAQTISKRAIADLLTWLGRTRWQTKWNAHDLVIEVWAVGIWVKQAGLISYQTLAEWMKYVANLKGSALAVQKKGDRLFLVQGSQKSWYAVIDKGAAEGTANADRYECECMLYRCRCKRLQEEMPKLYQSLEQQVFCHHTVAASLA